MISWVCAPDWLSCSGASYDLFSLGCVLYQLVTQRHPYPHGVPGQGVPYDPRDIAPELRLSDEVEEAFWFPLGQARAGELAATHRYVREGVERLLPAWRYGERVVWGLTYEILSGFLRVAP